MIDAAHRSAWLAWLATEKRYGDNTLNAYARDLDDFSAFVVTTKAVPGMIDRFFEAGWAIWRRGNWPAPPSQDGYRRFAAFINFVAAASFWMCPI